MPPRNNFDRSNHNASRESIGSIASIANAKDTKTLRTLKTHTRSVHEAYPAIEQDHGSDDGKKETGGMKL